MKLVCHESVLVALANMRSIIANGHTSILEPSRREAATAVLTMMSIDLEHLPAVDATREQELSIIHQKEA